MIDVSQTATDGHWESQSSNSTAVNTLTLFHFLSFFFELTHLLAAVHILGVTKTKLATFRSLDAVSLVRFT